MSIMYETIHSDQNQWLKRCKALQQKKISAAVWAVRGRGFTVCAGSYREQCL